MHMRKSRSAWQWRVFPWLAQSLPTLSGHPAIRVKVEVVWLTSTVHTTWHALCYMFFSYTTRKYSSQSSLKGAPAGKQPVGQRPTYNWQRWLQSQVVISGCKAWQTRQQMMMVLGGRQKKSSQQLAQPDCEAIKMLKSWCRKLLGRSSHCSRQIYSKYLYTVCGDSPHRPHYCNICQNALIMGWSLAQPPVSPNPGRCL